jgi:hypothetical protein
MKGVKIRASTRGQFSDDADSLNRGSLAALSGATPTPGFPPGSRGVQSHVPVIGSSGAHPRARLRADSAEISAMASVRTTSAAVRAQWQLHSEPTGRFVTSLP